MASGGSKRQIEKGQSTFSHNFSNEVAWDKTIDKSCPVGISRWTGHNFGLVWHIIEKLGLFWQLSAVWRIKLKEPNHQTGGGTKAPSQGMKHFYNNQNSFCWDHFFKRKAKIIDSVIRVIGTYNVHDGHSEQIQWRVRCNNVPWTNFNLDCSTPRHPGEKQRN